MKAVLFEALYSFGAVKSIFIIREKTEVISKITEKSSKTAEI